MRYFKIVLACFGFIFTVVGVTVGVMFLTGKFDKEVIQPEDIAFEITEKLTEDDFEVTISTTTENVTEKDITLSLTNQTEKDGYISDGVVTVPKVVKLGTPFVVQVNKTTYEGMDEEWNVGGTSVIRAKSTNPLIQEASPLTVEVDVPVHSLSVELVTTTGSKIGTVSAKNANGLLSKFSSSTDDPIVELAVGSVVRLKPVFIPAKSSKTTRGEDRKVIFEIPTAWRGIHIDFVDGENDLIEILRQTTVEEIKINAYCFKTSADEYAAQSAGYSDEELITMMNAKGVSGQSYQIFGTNQKITSFTSSTKDERINLSINSPLTLLASGTAEGAFDLGLAIASDAGTARLEDKIAVIKLYAYWQNALGKWEDAGDKLMIVGQTSSDKSNGVRSKINKADANLSSWKIIASEKGTYKLVAKLSYEYYSSSSSTPSTIEFEVEYDNIFVSEPISSELSWKSSLPAIKQLVVLDGATEAEKYYPTLNMSDYVDIKNANATYKAVRFFAYSTEGLNLTNVIGCTLYAGNFDVPDSSTTYEVYEIPNGILTAKDVGSLKIFFVTVVTDYLGNPKMQNGQYVIDSYSDTKTINVIKSLKSLDASMSVNNDDNGNTFNQNTDDETKDYIFHVRQQNENVFMLTLTVDDVDIFERDFEDGKIHINFLLGGEVTDILKVSDVYDVDRGNSCITFKVGVGNLPDNNQPTLECKISYDLDSRLDRFVANNGKRVQIKVLNGFAQLIYFDAVKDATPKNSADNPIEVELKFTQTGGVATSAEYSITFNGKTLVLEDLSKVTINEDALNKTYTLSSSDPSVISIEEKTGNDPQLSILGSTEEKDVVITAMAADGSGLTANLYFKVLASAAIKLEAKAHPEWTEKEISIDGYQDNSINFSSEFKATASGIDISSIMEYDVDVSDMGGKVSFDNNTLKILSTFGSDASLQLQITTNFGFLKIIPIRIKSCINISTNYTSNDLGLDDADFVDRGETPPSENGTRVYAENQKTISFKLTQVKPESTDIDIYENDFEYSQSAGIELSYDDDNKILTITFDPVAQKTEKTIVFKKSFSTNDQYAFTFTMKFLVFPNVKVSYVSEIGTEGNPAEYKNGETVIYDSKDAENGLIKLERILGSSVISENATLEAKLNGEWQTLTPDEGKFVLPSSYRATDGGFVEIRIICDGYVLEPVKIYLNPYFDETTLQNLDAKLLYDGKLYVPFVADGIHSITFGDTQATYSIIDGTSEKLIQIKSGKIERIENKTYTKIITSEKLRIENNNGVKELPIIILPVDYPFVVYGSTEYNLQDKETYRTVDLKTIIESETIYDTLEASSDETINLGDKIQVGGINDGSATITITNADGSTNNYVNFDKENLTLSANSVGKDKMIYVNVKCGAEFEDAFSFIYRIKVTANQQIKVFYPYIEYNEEEYNVENAQEYLYFEGKNQVSVDLLEEFDINKTPNKSLLDKYFKQTGYARRFVIVREKDGEIVPLDHKDLHFEIASVGIGTASVSGDKVSNYATISEVRSTNGDLQSAMLFINRYNSTSLIYVTIKAYTSSGAEAYYRFRVGDNPVTYKVLYEGKEVVGDDYQVATSGQSTINLNEKVTVKTNTTNSSEVDPSSYSFYLIIKEGIDTDYAQFIKLNGSTINISMLVNDVNTTLVIYNATGEMARFELLLKCTIDHEVKSSTIGTDGQYDISKNVEFFNAAQSDTNYSMKEVEVELYARDYLNDSTSSLNNLYTNIGSYSIKDISADYTQYVLLDNIKVYAENLVKTWGGTFYVEGDDGAKYDVQTDDNMDYIQYNGETIYAIDGVIEVPLAGSSTSSTEFVECKITETSDSQYVIIPHFSFTKQNERDCVLFEEITYEGTGREPTTENHAYGTFDSEGKNVLSCQTYVYVFISGKYVRYKVYVDEDKETGEETFRMSVNIVTHNGQIYYSEVDKDNDDIEYVTIEDDDKNATNYYFTRFYEITYSGLSQNEKDENGEDKTDDNGKVINNVPYVRYMLGEGETMIDLRKILFFTQGTNSSDVLKLGGTSYEDGTFKFFKQGEEGEEELTLEKIGDDDESNWGIKIADENDGISYDKIKLVIKDTTGNFVVGRMIIVPTVATSSSTSTNNKTIFIAAGDTTKVDYTITKNEITLDEYAASMSEDGEGEDAITFTGAIADHEGWTKYEYSVSSNKYKENNNLTISINEDDGTISGLYGKEPWGDIKVEAKLQYIKIATLTTEIAFDEWIKDVIGETNKTLISRIALSQSKSSYDVLQDVLGDDYQVVAKDHEIDSDTGDIEGVAYGETVTLLLQHKCDKCGIWVTVGEKHECWVENEGDPTTITDLSNLTLSDDDMNTLSGSSPVEILSTDGNTKYVYTLTSGSSLLSQTDKNGNTTWTLTGSITKTTYTKHNFTASFEKTISIPSDGTTTDQTISILNGETTITSRMLNLSNGVDFKALATALGFTDDKILGYSSWGDVLTDCDVDWSKYDEDNKTFGGTKTINLTLTTKNPKHTGTFYIVNQEADKTKVHATGNLNEAVKSLTSDFTYMTMPEGGTEEEATEITSVVNVNTEDSPIYVLPMETKKTLTQTEVETIYGVIKDWFVSEDDREKWTYSDDNINKWGSVTKIEEGRQVETAAPITGDPFNTITIYQNGYAIGNLHIYLEDYSGDKAAENYYIYSKTETPSGGSGVYSTNLNLTKGTGTSVQSTEPTTQTQTTPTITFEINSSNELTTYITDGDETIYITENVKMDSIADNQFEYLFDNGLKLAWNNGDNKQIILYAIACKTKASELSFKFGDYTLSVSDWENGNSIYSSSTSGKDGNMGTTSSSEPKSTDPSITYFEGLVDRISQPTSNSRDEGHRVYKAEKAKREDRSVGTNDVIYKDKIEGEDFNFNKWQYHISFVDSNGETHEGVTNNDGTLNLSQFGDSGELSVKIENITDANGGTTGEYAFVLELSKTPPVTVVGGGGTVNSPDQPIDGATIVSGQTIEVDVTTRVFAIGNVATTIELAYPDTTTTDPDNGGAAGGEEPQALSTTGNGFDLTDDNKNAVIDRLYSNKHLSYLQGVWTSSGIDAITSNLFQITSDGISIKFGNNYYPITFDDSQYRLEEPQNGASELGDGKFSLELNEDLYVFSATLAGSGEERKISLSISPRFTYSYQIDNDSYVDVTTEGEGFDFETDGTIKITGKHVYAEQKITFTFNVLSGGKVIATAYYTLTVKPSFVATVSYPTISSTNSDGEEEEVKLETERFYAGASGENVFDITKASEISCKEDARIAVEKHAYGTVTKSDGTTSSCEVIYEQDDQNSVTITQIKIGNGTFESATKDDSQQSKSTQGGNTHKGTYKVGEETYSVSVYIPNLTVTYIAKNTSGSVTITSGDDSIAKASSSTDGVQNTSGKFKFSGDGDVTIAVWAMNNDDDANGYIFAEYHLVVCSSPIISAKITFDPNHQDANNASREILPINGSGPIKPFDTSANGQGNTTPRVQFLYYNGDKGNITLNQSKYDIWVRDVATIDVENNKFTISGTTYTINTGNTCVSWADGDTCTCTSDCSCGKCAKIQDKSVTINSLIGDYGFTLTFDESYSTVSLTSNVKLSQVTVDPTTISSDDVTFTLNGQNVSGTYSYVTKWDFKVEPTGLGSTTVEGNYDPDDPSTQLNYYQLTAGKDYDIIETFGLKKFFGEKFEGTNLTAEIYPNDKSQTKTGNENYIEFKTDSGRYVLSALGAPNGATCFRIVIYPFGKGNPTARKVVGIELSSALHLTTHYQDQDNAYDDYGLITSDVVSEGGTFTYDLFKNGSASDFTITKNDEPLTLGITGDIYFTIYDDNIGDVQLTTSSTTGTITGTQPILNKRTFIIKVYDKYGWVDYIKYVVAAKTQVNTSERDITFTTGDVIEWTGEQSFPITFAKSDGSGEQYASFYTASLSGATEKTVEGKLITNVSDSYGSNTSLRASDGTLYGVQLNSVITEKKWDDDQSDIEDSNLLVRYQSNETISYINDGGSFEVVADSTTYLYTWDGSGLKYKEKVADISNNTFTIGTTTYTIDNDKVTWNEGDNEEFVSIDSSGQFKISNTTYIKVEKVIYNAEIEVSLSTGRYVLKDGSYAVKLTNKQYIPYLNSNEAITFDTYKLASVTEAITKSFDKYKKQVVYDDSNMWDSSSSSSSSSVIKDGVLTLRDDATSYVIELYTSTSSSSTPAAIVVFDVLEVEYGDTLYYAEREKADEGYKFGYSIKIEGTEIVGEGNKIKNIGNALYGSASSLNTTLVITVKKNDETKIDDVEVPITLKFSVYPQITQTVSALPSFDYVGLGDNIKTILDKKKTNNQIQLINNTTSSSSSTPNYYTVLGATTELGNSVKATKMASWPLMSGDLYDSANRILTLTASLSDNKATVNNILYTYDKDNNTLTIGYKKVNLTNRETTDGGKSTIYEYVDEATSITYAVDTSTSTSTLMISKEVDNSNEAIINNIKYKVEVDSNNSATVTYETLYETVYVVWKYDNNTYWAPWNYKVVDKFNKVEEGSEDISVQEGTFNVKLDWVAKDDQGNVTWRLNSNTMKLIDSSSKTNYYDIKHTSTVGESYYYVTIDDQDYKIVLESNAIKFKADSIYYPENSTSDTALTLQEENTTNSSWADAIILTGDDGEKTSLTDAFNAKKCKVIISGAEYELDENGEVTIDEETYSLNENGEVVDNENNVVSGAKVLTIKVGDIVLSESLVLGESSSLSGQTFSVKITYVGIDGVETELKIDDKAISIKFESRSFQQSSLSE